MFLFQLRCTLGAKVVDVADLHGPELLQGTEFSSRALSSIEAVVNFGAKE